MHSSSARLFPSSPSVTVEILPTASYPAAPCRPSTAECCQDSWDDAGSLLASLTASPEPGLVALLFIFHLPAHTTGLARREYGCAERWDCSHVPGCCRAWIFLPNTWRQWLLLPLLFPLSNTRGANVHCQLPWGWMHQCLHAFMGVSLSRLGLCRYWPPVTVPKGGGGALAQECVSLYPHSTVTIYDLPKVVRVAKEQFISPEERQIAFHEGRCGQRCGGVAAVSPEPGSAQGCHSGGSSCPLWAVSQAAASPSRVCSCPSCPSAAVTDTAQLLSNINSWR